MKIGGIVVEYNPFHYGHLRHIETTKKLTQCELLIAVMSGNFVQRGEPAIIDKWQRCQAALNHGVDLVIELPYIYTTQAAHIFAQKAVETLINAGCNMMCFGSETNNLEELKEIAGLPVNVTNLKERLRKGESFPKAYGLLADSIYPNDALNVCYIRANQDRMQLYSIQRDSDYNSDDMHTHAGASAIRKAIFNNEDYRLATPLEINNPVQLSDYYPYLRQILIMRQREELQKYFLVEEGIEKLLKDKAFKYANFEDFINNCISKRYTRSRIQRMLIHILNEDTKEEVHKVKDYQYLRVLGFNQKGQAYLKENKDLNFITSFKEIAPSFKVFEERALHLYTYLFDEEERQYLLKRELQAPLILKD